MSHRKSADPLHRLGVFKTLNEVPPHRRLDVFADEYADEDTYGDYCEDALFPEYDSKGTRERARAADNRWRDHMNAAGRHHALADPAHVETWATGLLDDMAPRSAYETHWVRIEGFYDWLCNRTDHPHSYSPVLMAAAVPSSAARAVWDIKLGRRRATVERRERMREKNQ